MEKQKEILKKMSIEQLIEQWEMTGLNYNENTGLEMTIVRGWIMDEIESREPEAFGAWYDDFAEDEELRAYILK